MLCAIWCHFYNLKNVKKTHGGMSLLVKLQAYFTKSNTPLRLFFTFLNLYKWYQIAQCITLKINGKDDFTLDGMSAECRGGIAFTLAHV